MNFEVELSRITDPERFEEIRRYSESSKVGWAASAYDLLHPGHVLYLCEQFELES